MATIVVPFRGTSDKQRLAPAGRGARARLAVAMLTDVLAACAAVGRTVLVTKRDAEAARALAASFGVDIADDPGSGQGDAVAAGLLAADGGTVLVVNADVPCATPRDLFALLGATPNGGMSLVRADDGTTNALGLAAPWLFAPLYGPGSADRFAERARRLGAPFASVDLPNLADDVDGLADLERLEGRLGPWTEACLHSLRTPLAH